VPSVTATDLLRTSVTLSFVRRYRDTARLAEALSAVCQVSARRPETLFVYTFEGEEIKDADTSPESLSGSSPPIVLFSAGEMPVTLTWHRDPLRDPTEDIVRIHVPIGAPWVSTMSLALYLRDVALAYEADVAWLNTYDLAILAAESARRRWKAAVPADTVQFVPQPPSWFGAVPARLVEQFTQLVPAELFDRTVIPETVHWANVWTTDMIDTVGRERIANARWFYVEKIKNGMLLVAAGDPPDRSHIGALEAVASAIETLSLPVLQAQGIRR
jgi:hypothetical protein